MKALLHRPAPILVVHAFIVPRRSVRPSGTGLAVRVLFFLYISVLSMYFFFCIFCVFLVFSCFSLFPLFSSIFIFSRLVIASAQRKKTRPRKNSARKRPWPPSLGLHRLYHHTYSEHINVPVLTAWNTPSLFHHFLFLVSRIFHTLDKYTHASITSTACL